MFDAGKPFMEVRAEGSEHPVFSEAFLYECMDKEDARFVLAVAEEYDEVIQKLGTPKVRRLLGRCPDCGVRLTRNELGTHWCCRNCGYIDEEAT